MNEVLLNDDVFLKIFSEILDLNNFSLRIFL